MSDNLRFMTEAVRELVAIGAAGHWRTRDTIVSVSGVLIAYGALELILSPQGQPTGPDLLGNNLFFLILTSVLVVVGNHKFNELALREFEARFELGGSSEWGRGMLEAGGARSDDGGSSPVAPISDQR